MLAGAGRADIDLPASLFPIDGFTGQHDGIKARVLLLARGSQRVALAVVDQTSLPETLVAQLTDTVHRVGGVDAANVWIVASHTFSAPHVLPVEHAPAADRAKLQQLATAIDAAVRKASAEAAGRMHPARIGYGVGESRVAVNRDVQTHAGWWLGANDAGASDKQVGVVRIEDLSHHPIAIVMNYAVQSSVMEGATTEGGGKLVTADLAGAVSRHVERQYGGNTVALFLTGAAGDQAPYLSAYRYVPHNGGRQRRVDIHDAGFVLVDLLGERLGVEVVRVSDAIRIVPDADATLRMTRGMVRVTGQVSSPDPLTKRPTHHYRFEATGDVNVPVWYLQIGAVALVGVQPELSSVTGMAIKQRSPFPQTMVATMVNGAAKYMPDTSAYERITYEAMSAPFAKGAAEAVAENVSSTLGALRADALKAAKVNAGRPDAELLAQQQRLVTCRISPATCD